MLIILWILISSISWTALREAGEAMLMLFAIIGSIYGAYVIVKKWYREKLKPKINKFTTMVDEWPMYKAAQETMVLDLMHVKHQVFPNNGGSIVDKLNVLMDNQSTIKMKVRAQMNTDSSPSFVIDKKGDLVYVNDAWLSLTGFQKAEQAYGIGWLKAIPEEDQKTLIDEHEQQLSYPSDFFGKVRFKNIQTGFCVDTICRVTCVKSEHSGELIEKIGQLQIIKP